MQPGKDNTPQYSEYATGKGQYTQTVNMQPGKDNSPHYSEYATVKGHFTPLVNMQPWKDNSPHQWICNRDWTSHYSMKHKLQLPVSELGTRQDCRDNMTMFSGHKVVFYCKVAIFVVAIPSTHRDLNTFNIFLLPEALLRCRVNLSRSYKNCRLPSCDRVKHVLTKSENLSHILGWAFATSRTSTK